MERALRIPMIDTPERIINRQFFISNGFKGCNKYGTYYLMIVGKFSTQEIALYDEGENVWMFLPCFYRPIERRVNIRKAFVKKIFDDLNIEYVG